MVAIREIELAFFLYKVYQIFFVTSVAMRDEEQQNLKVYVNFKMDDVQPNMIQKQAIHKKAF